MKHINRLLILLLFFNLIILDNRIVAKNKSSKITPIQNKQLNQAKALTKNGSDEKAIQIYYELLDLVNNKSVYLEEYARTMIGQEELHVLEVEKMLKENK